MPTRLPCKSGPVREHAGTPLEWRNTTRPAGGITPWPVRLPSRRIAEWQCSLDALAHRRNFEPVANLCARTVDRMWRKLQYAGRFQGHLGDAERANMLFDIDDLLVLAEEN